MKYIKTFLILSIVFFSGMQVSAFSDIENNWYKESISDLKTLGIISGFNDDTFHPNDNSTRAEILKMILNAAKIEVTETSQSCFSDVDVNAWYSKYICTAKDLGISKGYEDNTFQPNNEITVLETLAFVMRAFQTNLEYLGEGTTWYQKYQAYADSQKVIPKHAYTIDTLINRGRAADVMKRMRDIEQEKKLDYLSSGCSINPTLQSGEYTINIGGNTRSYLLYVPSGMQQGQEKGLIVAFHGRTNSNEMVRDYMKLGGSTYRSSNDQQDFIVAYPAGKGDGPYSWSEYENIEFFDSIITEISENLCINRDKVFSVGHSLGSYMSNKVACQRGGVLRGMVGVASSGFDTDCTGPAASLILHLPDDHLSPYSAGEYAYALRTEKNYCAPEVKNITIGDIKNCQQKTSCSLGNTVIFCSSYTPYLNDPHSWPKNGSDDILNFLRNIEIYTQ